MRSTRTFKEPVPLAACSVECQVRQKNGSDTRMLCVEPGSSKSK